MISQAKKVINLGGLIKEKGGDLTNIDVGIPEAFNNIFDYIKRCLASFPDDTYFKESTLQKETRKILESIDAKYAKTRFSLTNILSLLTYDLREFGKKHLYNSDGFRTNYHT